MFFSIKIYSQTNGEIEKFLKSYYDCDIKTENKLFWNKNFSSPFEIIDMISIYIDNKEKFNISIWISIDKNVYICVTEDNINELIKYIYERFPN